jgi:HSF-type DNA-binding
MTVHAKANINSQSHYCHGSWFRQTQYASFQKQLNIYGFKVITSGRSNVVSFCREPTYAQMLTPSFWRQLYATGPDKNGYYHDLFLRSRLDLAQRIGRVERKPSLRPGARVVVVDDNPDFSKLSPMPRDMTTTATTTTTTTSAMSVPEAVNSLPAAQSQALGSLHGSLPLLVPASSSMGGTIEPLQGFVGLPTHWHNLYPTMNHRAAFMSVLPQSVIALPAAAPSQAMGSHASLHPLVPASSSIGETIEPLHGFVGLPTLWHNPDQRALVVPQRPLSLNSSVSPLYREQQQPQQQLQQYRGMDSSPLAPHWASACHQSDHVDTLAIVPSSSAQRSLIATSTQLPMRQDRTLASMATYEQLMAALLQPARCE